MNDVFFSLPSVIACKDRLYLHQLPSTYVHRPSYQQMCRHVYMKVINRYSGRTYVQNSRRRSTEQPPPGFHLYILHLPIYMYVPIYLSISMYQSLSCLRSIFVSSEKRRKEKKTFLCLQLQSSLRLLFALTKKTGLKKIDLSMLYHLHLDAFCVSLVFVVLSSACFLIESLEGGVEGISRELLPDHKKGTKCEAKVPRRIENETERYRVVGDGEVKKKR